MIEVEYEGYKFTFTEFVDCDVANECDLCGAVVIRRERHAQWHHTEGLVRMKPPRPADDGAITLVVEVTE